MTRLFCLLGFILVPVMLRADTFPDPDMAPADVIAATPGLQTYATKVKAANKFAVVIPASYKAGKPMPLVVSAHGNGGSGEGEANAWSGLPDKYNFILVCPSYYSSVAISAQSAADDNEMLKEVMKRVFASLNIDRTRVLHTGFSGGSLATWYVAAQHDDWFTALCLRSGNFYSEPEISLSRWRTRPIYVMWGTEDMAGIPDQGAHMLDFLQKTMDNKTVKHEIIPGGHHEGHPDLVAQWFAGLKESDFGPPDPDAPIHL